MASTDHHPSDGRPRREGRGFVFSFGLGRRCADPDCRTLLSRYNDATRCWVHDEASNRR